MMDLKYLIGKIHTGVLDIRREMVEFEHSPTCGERVVQGCRETRRLIAVLEDSVYQSMATTRERARQTKETLAAARERWEKKHKHQGARGSTEWQY